MVDMASLRKRERERGRERESARNDISGVILSLRGRRKEVYNSAKRIRREEGFYDTLVEREIVK